MELLSMSLRLMHRVLNAHGRCYPLTPIFLQVQSRKRTYGTVELFACMESINSQTFDVEPEVSPGIIPEHTVHLKLPN